MTNPYKSFPSTSFWSKSVSLTDTALIDPIIETKFRFDKDMKIASAGSCFAQQLSSRLKEIGINYITKEPPHSLLNDSEVVLYNYNTYSARYGNIYTISQLKQLFQRAFNDSRYDSHILTSDNYFIDAYRPRIQPKGFSSRGELELDRKIHYKAVRSVFEELDVFIFTLGLTEAWRSKLDKTTFPICPLVVSKSLRQEDYYLHNFSMDEIERNLEEFIDLLKVVNKSAKIILTVSPVPLVATGFKDHVLVSNCYSKSLLRVAAGNISAKYSNVDYFPSFEIVNTIPGYFSNDLRTVTQKGIDHVMKVFMNHYLLIGSNDNTNGQPDENVKIDSYNNIFEEQCDELIYQNK